MSVISRRKDFVFLLNFSKALLNIVNLYPETRSSTLVLLDNLVNIVKSPELRLDDKIRWNEDPLENLDGDKSHISNLSHLSCMIGNYKKLGVNHIHDQLYDSICNAMNRMILEFECLNLPTYPGVYIYIPYMLVAIVALKDYSDLNKGIFSSTVEKWKERATKEWIDKETGLLFSLFDESGQPVEKNKSSYLALNCYYLTLLSDFQFAFEQYTRLKNNYRLDFFLSGLKRIL